MASYNTTATVFTNLWMDGWIILPIRIRTEDHGSESVLHYWRCVRLCRWNELPNPNLQISKSPMPWHALTLACQAVTSA